jgi:ketosteroid isomerase-like protein
MIAGAVGTGEWLMSEHPNARLIRQGYAAFARGDLEAIRELMADDVVWHEPGRSPIAGDYKGPDGVLTFVRDLRARSENTFTVDLIDVVPSAERVIVLQEESATRKDRQLDVASAVDFEIHHGKITEVTVYRSDTYQFDAFWS